MGINAHSALGEHAYAKKLIKRFRQEFGGTVTKWVVELL